MFIFRADALTMGLEYQYSCIFIFTQKHFHEVFYNILLSPRLHDPKKLFYKYKYKLRLYKEFELCSRRQRYM